MVLVVLAFATLVLITGYIATPLGIKYTGLALALLCDLSFAWASLRHFQRRPQVSTTQKRVLRFTYLTAILHALVILYANHGSIYHFLMGSSCYIASLMLFWSAVNSSRGSGLQLFFSDASPRSLVTHGPYSEIRHPFYTAYSLAWVAGMLITNQPLLILTIIGSVWTYHAAARLEESQFARSPLAANYARYMETTGRFLPRLRLPELPPRTRRPARTPDRDHPLADHITMWGPPPAPRDPLPAPAVTRESRTCPIPHHAA
jgi:protein-S-isoprenylcysteine O-methyltransferase Ste14